MLRLHRFEWLPIAIQSNRIEWNARSWDPSGPLRTGPAEEHANSIIDR